MTFPKKRIHRVLPPNKLKYYLDKRHMTQTRLCDIVGVSRTTMHNWLYDGNTPKVHMAIIVAEALDVVVEDVWPIREVE